METTETSTSLDKLFKMCPRTCWSCLIRWVLDRLILAVLVLDDGELLWRGDGAVEVAIEPCAEQVGVDLRPPQEIILPGQLLRDLRTEA